MPVSDPTSFLTQFFEVVLQDLKEDGKWSLVPWVLLACVAAGGAAFYFLPDPLAKKGDILTLWVGLLTAQGIVLAVVLSSVQQIFASTTSPGFSSFLLENEVLKQYQVCMAIMQHTGIMSILVLVATGFAFLFELPPVYLRILIWCSLTSFLYSIRWLYGGSLMVRELVYYMGLFDAQRQKGGNPRVVSLEARESATMVNGN
ncbi:MAG: hypothetical protein KQJ78_11120 [Deltaproteobacteria bacterium]|nr:hypothetical protein [Deltaproteobacteria bacterium]